MTPNNNAAADAGQTALPARIGPYRILGLLGEGASGRVYLAEESEPPREIALKVLRTASLPAEAQQRFRREAELLARLEHPAIARLYAAGVADSEAGPLPYLAMERVHGQDLLHYAASRALSLEQKLALLAEIGRAVHYAHSRGVVHRDLKPANILVDAEGRPHILDFGVAHMVREDAGLTVDGQVLGTVPYMSAEQLAGSRQAGDPRSDVYALGVIAYQLLSGVLPYPGLSTSTVMEAIAVLRQSRAERLSRHLPAARGDTETVVMKAMAAEAAQRYGSAAELADELERVRDHQPIAARPPTAGYLLGLFVRRHRALSAALAVALLALIVGSLVSLRYGLAEAAARRQADASNAFLEKMLTAADPDQDLGRDLRVRELLDAARLNLRSETDPVVAASLHRTLGATYLSLAETDVALELLSRAIELSAAAEGEDALATRQARLAHGKALLQKTRFADADRELDALIALPSHDEAEWRLHYAAQRERAISALEQGNGDDGEARLRAERDALADRFGAEDSQTLVAAADHAAVMQINGKAKEALPEQERLLAIQTRRLGADDPETLDVQGSLATTLSDLDQIDRSLPLMRDVLARERRIYGGTHPKTLISLQNLASQTKAAGLNDESLALRTELLAGSRARFGSNHQRSIAAMAMMANLQSDIGQQAEAERNYRDAIAAARSDPSLNEAGIIPRANLATLLMKQKRLAEARDQYREVLVDARARYGSDDWRTAAFGANYGDCLFQLGDAAGARTELEASLKVLTEHLGADHDRSRDTREKLRKVYRALGLQAEADALPTAATPKN
ncbi:serine/threonine protein kinase [Stagnimonas aquatica]|uniref:Serine/threonine protein kinase n=1 Tax=Stagnimonas aquatica TaxID=2689987 RepID=A0A3N0V5Q7_9GAMM|nr:serine/threonine-protein kinase [Stagnimonas aquatica]ROH87798.1 serine/threonine protein kinase [Stagnimonas aquatica]